MSGDSPSQRVRRGLSHPVIDADGHILEYLPAVEPFLREAMGAQVFERYRGQRSQHDRILTSSAGQDPARTRIPQSSWWGTPARNTHDLSTAALPRLLHERMDEFGIDYSVLFGTKSFGIAAEPDPEIRRGLCRGFNAYFAETYKPFSDRLTVAGVVPMHTPEEAIDELEHIQALGLKVIGMPEGVLRSIADPEAGHGSPFLMPGQRHWFDTFGLDSAYDYDSVWARCEALGFAATCHGGFGCVSPYRFTSPTNYSYNHIGSFADGMHRLVKSLFIGGVTRRFPNLPFAVLECGVGWAAILIADLVEHWEKRNRIGLERLDPATIDWAKLEDDVRHFAPEWVEGTDLAAGMRQLPAVGSPPAELDDWRAVGADDEETLVSSFVEHFYFGCEADDRTIAFAFSPAVPCGARLRPVFSSDLSHWDVREMSNVVAEAFSLVEEGLLTERDFREFVCVNPARMLLAQNPRFFDGTVLESSAKDLAD